MSANESFDRMSKKLADNESAGFGGAAVIVFPSAGGVAVEPIELLILDPKGDVAQFLATLKTRLEMVQQEMSPQQGFRR